MYATPSHSVYWDMVKGPGPFTVLAPTDEAFAKVPKVGPVCRTKSLPGLCMPQRVTWVGHPWETSCHIAHVCR
jgi:hypothetical protein